MQADGEDSNAASELLASYWALSRKKTVLTSTLTCHDTSYRRQLQVGANYLRNFMQSCHYIHFSVGFLLPGHFPSTT